jgi:ElaB/YqjD/DUF883 family membrane-anchored ribosome-binding protein
VEYARISAKITLLGGSFKGKRSSKGKEDADMPVTNGTGEQVQDVVEDVSEDLHELGRELRHRADEVRKETVKTLNSAAATIRKEAREATEDSNAHRTADELAKSLERTAHYLHTHSIDQMGNEATRVVRQNPMRVALIAFAIGLLLGVVMRGNGDHK